MTVSGGLTYSNTMNQISTCLNSHKTNGTANRGGGGGGGATRDPSGTPSGTAGGSGGSGVVIMKFDSSKTPTVSGGLTYSSTTSGSYKIYTFTAGTGTVSFP